MSVILQADSVNLITTLIGDVPEADVKITMEQKDEGNAWVTTRLFEYVGSIYPAAQGQVVRRDVWVTMKTGLRTGIQSGL